MSWVCASWQGAQLDLFFCAVLGAVKWKDRDVTGSGMYQAVDCFMQCLFGYRS